MRRTRAWAVAVMVAFAGVGIVADTVPAVFLNHFYVVVDAETYEAAQASALLTRDFAPFEKRTTQRNDTSYTGVYWYGQRTYFELFEPGAQGPAGASGLALGVESAGASVAVEQAWKAARGTAGRGLRVFLMEYHGDFLARWYGPLTPARSITRADVLDRYVAKIGGRREGTLLEDVTGLTIGLAPESREALVEPLRAVGWTSRTEGTSVACSGPESVVLRLVEPGGGPPGITEVVFSLRQAAEAATHRLGTAELRLEGRSARLGFRPAR